jgi:hypothetical protein
MTKNLRTVKIFLHILFYIKNDYGFIPGLLSKLHEKFQALKREPGEPAHPLTQTEGWLVYLVFVGFEVGVFGLHTL